MAFSRKHTSWKAELEVLNKTNYNKRTILRWRKQALKGQNCLLNHNFIPFEHDNTALILILLNFFYCRHFIQWMDSSFKMDSNSVLFIVKCLGHIFTAQYSNFFLKIDLVYLVIIFMGFPIMLMHLESEWFKN